MAGERRTRADKARAQIQRQEHLTYSFTSEVKLTGNSKVRVQQSVPQKKEKQSINSLFAYDVRLIYQDLWKTVIITGVILAVVLGLRYGLG